MKHETIGQKSRPRLAAGASLALVAVAFAAPASAELLDAYVGAGLGQSQVRTDVPGLSSTSFKENHTAWKAFAGVRVISLLGAEVAYLDFGNPSGTVGGQSVRADLKGKSVLGLVYLPIPAPFIDVYGKAGYTRLDGSVSVNTSPAQRVTLDDDAFTAGAGVQFKFAGWGVRGEYERFSPSGHDPALWTLSIARHFL